MAEGESLLGQQLARATEIVPENIKINQTAAEMGLSAWATASQIKLKRMELEGKMQALVEKNRAMEIKSDLDRQQMQMRMEGMAAGHSIAEQRLALEADKARKGYDLTSQKMDLMRDKFDAAHDKEVDRNDAQAGLEHLESELAAEGKHRGDEGWDAEYMKRADQRGYFRSLAPSEWNKVHADVATGQNAAIKMRQNIMDTQIDSWKRDFGSDIYGTSGKTDTSILDDINSLPDATKKVPSKIFGDYWKTTVPDPGKKTVKGYDVATQKSVDKTVSVQELVKRKKEWDALQEQKRKLGQPKDYPDVGVYKDQPGTLKERALRISNDPTASSASKAAAEKYLKENP